MWENKIRQYMKFKENNNNKSNNIEGDRPRADVRGRMRYLEFGRDSNVSVVSLSLLQNRGSVEGLTVTDYLLPLLPSIFLPHEITLSSIEFYGATVFSNIIQVFRSCPNMTELTFTFVCIDEYKTLNWPSSTEFQARKLTTIEFNRDGGLTRDELIILQFFHTYCAVPALKNLIFNVMSYGYSSRHFQNEVMSQFGDQVPSSVLPLFMIKAAPTLKSLLIRRQTFVFYQDTGNPDPEILEGLCNIQLEKIRFQVDTLGIHYLLEGQLSLEKLDCTSHHERTRLESTDFSKLISALWKCLSQCQQTIRHAHAIGAVAFNIDDPSPFCRASSSDFIADLRNFENCSTLTNLWLSKMDNFPSRDRFFPEFFTFINGNSLPTTLVQLEIWVGRVIPEELLKLTRRFHQLTHLCFFKLCSVVPYVITLECFQNIISIGHSFLQAFFYNGFLHQGFCPQEIIVNSMRPLATENRRSWEVKISKGGCEFFCREPVPRF